MRLRYEDLIDRHGFDDGRVVSRAWPDIGAVLKADAEASLNYECDVLIRLIERLLLPALPVPVRVLFVGVKEANPIRQLSMAAVSENVGVCVDVPKQAAMVALNDAFCERMIDERAARIWWGR